ncbi:MAG: hypothetical protein E7470_04615 [Ruminococcaceae bacterium]|nr:hypothetical protein [Oscillospiraceae bacterium]
MPLQRVRGAESRIRNSLSNGPRRAQSNVFCTEYSATCRHTLRAGDMLVSQKRTDFSVNQGGTADQCLFVLGRGSLCQGRFVF